MLGGRGSGERPRIRDCQRDCSERGMLCGQDAGRNPGGGMLEDLDVWGSDYRGLLRGRGTGATLASGCVCIPPVPAGLCKPVYKAASCYEKWAKVGSVFPQGS